MNKTDFIAELCKKTGLSTEDGSKVNDVIENNNLLGNAAKIISQIAEKLNMAPGKTALFLPLKGVSMIDAEGQPFYGPEEDKALFETLRANIGPKVELVEMDNNVNDDAFAVAAAQKLLDLLES